MKPALRRGIDRVERQFDELYGFSPLGEQRSDRISNWSVGQHLDHLMKADRSILRNFPTPAEGPHKPVTMIGRLVLLTGWIPRGQGRAPSASLPEAPSSSALANEVKTVRDLFARAVEPADRLVEKVSIADHPYFGGLNRVQWLRFVAVHHHHHTKIIRDILRAQ